MNEEDICEDADYQQHEKDWIEFAKALAIRKDIEVNRQDPTHQEMFYFFTAGAHAEFAGKLDIKSKTP